MRAESFQQVQELLADALEIPPAQRTAWLDSQGSLDPTVRAEVRDLLAADQQGKNFLEKSALGAWLEQRREEEVELAPGARIGPYRIERLLGHGGMGRVLLAGRDDDVYHQQVAIKLADGDFSDEALARLRRERQILAAFDHPHIARLLDGGITALGQPFLVMEFIEGQPLHQFSTDLSLEERLRLFRKVLAGVAYAHRHLVLHLDLKPDNILVDGEGQPKLLDFGISKMLAPEEEDPLTVTSRPFTPAYASPEQLRGERLTTASDIYSLGRLLFQILTDSKINTTAFDTEFDPPRPSEVVRQAHLRRSLQGDLDAIVSKALATRPEGRYATVEQFDADIVRHLEGRPIAARPATRLYRASRFCRRHWLSLTLLTALFLTSLATILVVSSQARRIEIERQRAENLRTDAEQVATFLEDLLNRLEPGELDGGHRPRERHGMPLPLPDLLDRGAAALDEVTMSPQVRTRLRKTLAAAYRSWGDEDSAEALFSQATAARSSQDPDRSSDPGEHPARQE